METSRFFYGDPGIASFCFRYLNSEINIPVIRLLPIVTQNSGFDYLKIKRNHAGVMLKWKIKNPRKDDVFCVFRNASENRYEKIGMINLEGLIDEQDEFVFIDNNAPEKSCTYKVERYRFNNLLARSETIQIDAVNKNPFITFSTYPSPVTETIGILLYSSVDHNIIVSIHNTADTLILEKKISAETGLNHYIIPASNIQAGNHTIAFRYPNYTEIIKKTIQVFK